jgi:hypothetical protein
MTQKSSSKSIYFQPKKKVMLEACKIPPKPTHLENGFFYFYFYLFLFFIFYLNKEGPINLKKKKMVSAKRKFVSKEEIVRKTYAWIP